MQCRIINQYSEQNSTLQRKIENREINGISSLKKMPSQQSNLLLIRYDRANKPFLAKPYILNKWIWFTLI